MFDLQKLKTRIVLSYLVLLTLSLLVALVVYGEVKQAQYQMALAQESHEVFKNLNLASYALANMGRSGRGYLLISV
jgi:CHASE3 domain sensor protein